MAFAAGVLVACGLGVSELSKRPELSPPLSENIQGLASAPWTRLPVGAACEGYADRNGACSSGFCLSTAPGFPPKGVCSIACEPSQADSCPDGPDKPWACAQMFPNAWVCAPPEGRTPGEATLRGKPMPLPSSKPDAVGFAAAPDAGQDGGR